MWMFLIAAPLLTTPFLLRAWFIASVPDIHPFDEVAFCDEGEKIPEAQNAFTHYREAYRLKEAVDAARKASGKVMSVENYEEVVAKGWSAADDSLKEWCQEYHKPLAEWKKGTELSDAFFLSPRDIVFKVDVTAQFPLLNQVRDFARLARFEGLRHESDGDVMQAKEWYISILRCSRHFTRHSFNLQRMTGSALHALASVSLVRWAEDSRLTAEQLHTALSEIQAADRMTDAVSSTLKADYLIARNTLNQRGWLKSMTSEEDEGGNEPAATLMNVVLWLVGEPQTTQKVLRQILANQLNEIDNPLSEQQPQAGLANAALFQPDQKRPGKPNQLYPVQINQAVSRLMITRIFVPAPQNFDQFTNSVTRDRARQHAVEIGLAAQAYRREHGEFPEDPAALVPVYFDKWPVDPFSSTGQPMHYRRDNRTSATVWSVGPNGIDDNGDVIYTEQQPAKDVAIVLEAR
jgi:hypothetical protein